MYGACFRINEVFFKISCGIFHHKFHTSLPQTFRHSVSNPKPNESFLRYSTTAKCSTFRTTIVLSSTFRTKTCATLQNTKERNVCLNVLYVYLNWKWLWSNDVTAAFLTRYVIVYIRLFCEWQSADIHYVTISYLALITSNKCCGVMIHSR